jgi:anti-sigma factor RsiW
MTAEDHRRREDDLAAWMLGALEESEAREFERHLAQCERCRTDLEWLRPAVDAIPASVTQVAAPPRLRGELLGTVRAEARRAAAPPRGAQRWLAGLRVPRPAMAALGAAIVVGAGVAGYALRGDEDSETLEVRAAPAARGTAAELVVEEGTGTLQARGMPRLRRDQVFQAWVRDEGEAALRPSTLFVARRDGTATASIPGLEDAAQVLVTREPHGGSAAPTAAPMLRANL